MNSLEFIIINEKISMCNQTIANQRVMKTEW